MTKKSFVYKMTLRILLMRLAHNLSNICYRCERQIFDGDMTYSRNAGSSKSKSKVYHKRCAQEVNIL